MILRSSTNPRAWCSAIAGDPPSWRRPLSPRLLAALDQTIRELRQHPPAAASLTALDVRTFPSLDCPEEVRPILDILERGRGFVVVAGLPAEGYSAQELQIQYWLLGQLLGRPMEQNVQGTLLYDVRDTGQDVRYGARFSVTSSESTFHTDNSFGDDILDYIGLLCLQPAHSGGISQIVSLHTIYEELRDHHPEVLEELARPFHFDRRGGVRPGEAPTATFPILLEEGEALIGRYLRYWIETGHARAGQPLTPAQVRAMDVLDELANQPQLRVQFQLQPGEMLWVNNRWILHNRTAFEDYAEPERRRHYVRLWLRRRDRPGP